MLKFIPYLCAEVNDNGNEYKKLGEFPDLNMAISLLQSLDPKVRGSGWEFNEAPDWCNGHVCLDFWRSASWIRIEFDLKHPVEELVLKTLGDPETLRAHLKS